MLKKDEISNPNSCLNKAKDDERIFVLRAKDLAAPSAIREWVSCRIAIGLNNPGDAKIIEALDCARLMEAERKEMAL